MSVLDVLNQPWAITPPKLEALSAVYERHLAGVSLDEAAIRAAIGGDPRSPGAKKPAYTVENGVAIVPVDGVLAKKMNLFTAISGGMSTEMLTDAINAAIADPSVHSILLAMDTPGGEVDGTQQIAAAVAASPKPTAAWVDGMCCSAGMWIATQCGSIWADSDTATVGSIAVVMQHVDQSKANEMQGIKPTHITTGKFKRILNSDAPLSQDGLAYAQGKLDYLHTLFINAVAQGRKTTPENVDTTMAEGQTFFAQQAVDIGLIDGIQSQAQVIDMLVRDRQFQLTHPGASAFAQPLKVGSPMSFRVFATEAEFNAAISEAESRGRASATVTTNAVEAARAEGLAAGATAERERIAAIEKLPLAKNHPKVIAEMRSTGASVAEAKDAILVAEDAAQVKFAVDRKQETSQAVAATPLDPTKEAQERAAAAAQASDKDNVNPTVHAAKIRAQIAKAKSEGRTISSAQADAELAAA